MVALLLLKRTGNLYTRQLCRVVSCLVFGGDAKRLRKLVRPPGGIVLMSPLARPLVEVRVDGRVVALDEPDRVQLRDIRAEVLLRYG